MSRRFEIGVIGGGASAVCLLDALAQADSAPGGITVFESADDLWRGRPFQRDLSSVRVNAPPDDMSVRFGDTGHFERWLAARDAVLSSPVNEQDPFCGIRFVPRSVFGDYLDDAAGAALVALIERGWRISVVRERVVSAVALDVGFELNTAQGKRFRVDYAALCVGVGRPADSYGLAGSPGFVAEPYPVFQTMDGIDADDEVGIIGSGLTGVDAVLALAASGHRGPIRLLSRRGVLPGVRQRPVQYTLQHFTPQWLRDAAARGEMITLGQLIAMMRAELASAGEDLDTIAAELAALDLEDSVVRLRRQLAEVNSASLALRILQRAVPDTGPDLWPLLPEQQKLELLRSHYRAVMSLCCPMPPTSAATLLKLIDSGQLQIVAGLQTVEPLARGGFSISTVASNYHADVMINAVSPPAHKIPPKAQSLIESLIEAGVAERHIRGGVHVDRATSQLTVDGQKNPRAYALGDLTAGTLFFTFGIPSLVDRAFDIAGALLFDAQTSQSPRVGESLQAV